MTYEYKKLEQSDKIVKDYKKTDVEYLLNNKK